MSGDHGDPSTNVLGSSGATGKVCIDESLSIENGWRVSERLRAGARACPARGNLTPVLANASL